MAVPNEIARVTKSVVDRFCTTASGYGQSPFELDVLVRKSAIADKVTQHLNQLCEDLEAHAFVGDGMFWLFHNVGLLFSPMDMMCTKFWRTIVELMFFEMGLLDTVEHQWDEDNVMRETEMWREAIPEGTELLSHLYSIHREWIRVPAGGIECFRMRLGFGLQTFFAWYNDRMANANPPALSDEQKTEYLNALCSSEPYYLNDDQ